MSADPIGSDIQFGYAGDSLLFPLRRHVFILQLADEKQDGSLAACKSPIPSTLSIKGGLASIDDPFSNQFFHCGLKNNCSFPAKKIV